MSSDGVRIGLLGDADLDDYACLVESDAEALVHATPQWRDFLQDILSNAEPTYFGMRRDGRLVAALPVFTCGGPAGPVVNALPYFGSHGDIISTAGEDRAALSRSLAEALADHCRKAGAVACNLVAHPLRTGDGELTAAGLQRVDDRVGQISALPKAGSDAEALQAVLTACQQKTRNLVRKGLRFGASIEACDGEADWRDLHHHHVEGMQRIGGIPKPWSHIEALRRRFPAAQRRLYIARKQGVFAAGLLVLLHRHWVEYFMPVSAMDWRSEQPLSALIAHAMVDAIGRGQSLWNWGGTWRSQEGVHHFKAGWGAQDHPYGYYGWAWRAAFSPDDAANRAAYPNFYLYPFGAG